MPQVECAVCHNEFYVKPSHQKLGWGKYCSQVCRTKSQFNGSNFLCLICGQKVYRSKFRIRHSSSGNYFCSKSCQTKWRNSYFIEKLHPNWLTGINAYREILTRSGVPQICVSCGIDDKRVLVVHHIDHNRENNEKENLVWLCHNCHHLVHFDEKFKSEFVK